MKALFKYLFLLIWSKNNSLFRESSYDCRKLARNPIGTYIVPTRVSLSDYMPYHVRPTLAQWMIRLCAIIAEYFCIRSGLWQADGQPTEKNKIVDRTEMNGWLLAECTRDMGDAKFSYGQHFTLYWPNWCKRFCWVLTHVHTHLHSHFMRAYISLGFSAWITISHGVLPSYL